jgi:hypothetical protein
LSPAPTSPPPPGEETPASSSKATSRHSKAETKSSIKAKGKTKAKAKVAAPAAVEEEDVEMHDGDKKATEAKESDPPEEDNDSGEEELEDVEERKVASKRCLLKFLNQCYMLNYHFIVRKLPWIGEMRWMWKVGKSAIRMSSR